MINSLKTGLIKKLFIFFVAVMLALGVSSCNRYSNGPSGKNPLWKVTSDKGPDKGTVYLLGSVHLLKHSDYPLSRKIEEAFFSSGTVVFELDLKESSTEDTQNLINIYSQFQDGRTLEGSLTNSTFLELKEIFGARGLNIEKAANLKPWYIATILTVSELAEMGFKPGYGVDIHYYTKAMTMGKDIQALETVEYQVALFNSMSMDDQEAFVRQTLREIGTIEDDFPEIVKAWKNGDTVGLLKLLEQCEDFKETCQLIIDRRNRNWLPAVEKLVASGGSSMVIAGAAHMVGKGGLLNLLREKGYRVEQL